MKLACFDILLLNSELPLLQRNLMSRSVFCLTMGDLLPNRFFVCSTTAAMLSAGELCTACQISSSRYTARRGSR